MKRIIALVLTLIMVVCMVAACGGTGTGNTTGNTKGTTGSSNSTTQTSQTTTPIPEEPKDESLLVYLNFDFDNLVEGDKPYFEDMSGNDNHAYIGGRMVVADGPTDDHGEAIELDTVGNYLTIKHNDMFNFKAEDEYTIDFWFQADTEKLYSQHTWPCPFTKGSPNSTSYFGCWINAGKVYYGTGALLPCSHPRSTDIYCKFYRWIRWKPAVTPFPRDVSTSICTLTTRQTLTRVL